MQIMSDQCYEDAGGYECLPLAVVEVVPLNVLATDDPPSSKASSSQGSASEDEGPPPDVSSLYVGPPPSALSAPMVKMQLRKLTRESMVARAMSSAGGGSMRMILDRQLDDDRGESSDNSNELNDKFNSLSLNADEPAKASAYDSNKLHETLKTLSLDESAGAHHTSSSVRIVPAQREIIGGDVFLSNPKWTMSAIGKHLVRSEEQQHTEKVPILRLLSDDPTDCSDGVPCWVRGYAPATTTTDSAGDNINSCAREVVNCAVVTGTLVRILPPIPARILRASNEEDDEEDNDDSNDSIAILEPRATFEGHPRAECGVPLPLPLFTELSGEVDTYQMRSVNNNSSIDDSDFILSCHDAETIRGLLVRMKALLDRPIKVGTTVDAIAVWEARRAKGRRRRRALEAICSPKRSPTGSSTTDRPSDKVDTCSNLFRDGALTVHDPFEASGKTKLVQTLARHVLNCSAVHTFNATTLFAKYGANGADVALESLLHSIVLSAAVEGGRMVPGRKRGNSSSPPSICIILDHLETFVPPAMLGGRSAGDPATPALNSMVAYLNKLTSSIKSNGRFPFPTKNPMYNINGSKGFVASVHVCIIGIITCDDDGGRKGIDGDSYTVLDVLGSNRYRLSQPSSRTRYEAFRLAFEEAGIKLSAEAMGDLPITAASATSARGREFRKVAKHLALNIMKENGELREASTSDIEEAMKILSRDAPKDTAIGVTFLSRSGNTATQQKRRDIFSSVGGNTEAKLALEDALALDPRKRRILSAFGLSPPIGVMLYGPPGTGKTLLAKATALALESESPIGGAFINLRASDIVRGEVGKSEKLLVSSFDLARTNTPAVIFIDEFQSLFTERSGRGSGQLASTLLQCMDDVSRWRNADAMVEQKKGQEGDIFDAGKGRIIVLGATNVPWMVDKAFLRPGRFDRVVYVGLPNLAERESILKVHVGSMRIYKGNGANENDELCKGLAQQTEGLSGADLFGLCRMAAIRCVNDEASAVEDGVKEEHFVDALKDDVVRSCSDDLVDKLLRWSPRGRVEDNEQ